ncbi:transposase [Enterococcus casseliflavus]|nr:transposase [Enterococcus casseliflavus]
MTFELKLKIVKEYLSGVGGYRHLANKYGISSKSQVSDWVNAIVNTERKVY